MTTTDAMQVKEALELLLEDARGVAWRAHAVYNRKTKRYDFNDEMWKAGGPKQFEAVKIIESFLSDPSPAALDPVTVEALDLLQLQQRGRAHALRLLDGERKQSDAATLAMAQAYEECGNELRALIGQPSGNASEAIRDARIAFHAGTKTALSSFTDAELQAEVTRRVVSSTHRAGLTEAELRARFGEDWGPYGPAKEALERIKNYPHSGDATAQGMAAIAREALGSSSEREYDADVAPCDDAEFGMKP